MLSGERERVVKDIARYSQKYNQGGTGKKAWVREGEGSDRHS